MAVALALSGPLELTTAIETSWRPIGKVGEITATDGRSPWQMRTGVHSGGLTAGVIGRHKFAYDIWGDTVNVASRVQSVCPANEVLVSEATAQQLSPNIALADEHEVELKGRGRAKVFRAVRMRQGNV